MVAKPLCPLYKNIIKPLDRARYPELRYSYKNGRTQEGDRPRLVGHISILGLGILSECAESELYGTDICQYDEYKYAKNYSIR